MRHVFTIVIAAGTLVAAAFAFTVTSTGLAFADTSGAQTSAATQHD